MIENIYNTSDIYKDLQPGLYSVIGSAGSGKTDVVVKAYIDYHKKNKNGKSSFFDYECIELPTYLENRFNLSKDDIVLWDSDIFSNVNIDNLFERVLAELKLGSKLIVINNIGALSLWQDQESIHKVSDILNNIKAILRLKFKDAIVIITDQVSKVKNTDYIPTRLENRVQFIKTFVVINGQKQANENLEIWRKFLDTEIGHLLTEKEKSLLLNIIKCELDLAYNSKNNISNKGLIEYRDELVSNFYSVISELKNSPRQILDRYYKELNKVSNILGGMNKC